jgi:hypothetical protein
MAMPATNRTTQAAATSRRWATLKRARRRSMEPSCGSGCRRPDARGQPPAPDRPRRPTCPSLRRGRLPPRLVLAGEPTSRCRRGRPMVRYGTTTTGDAPTRQLS